MLPMPKMPYLVKILVPKNVTLGSATSNQEVQKFMNKDERGFSIIELLIVVVIIGTIAGLAVPALRKGVRAAENGNTFASLRTIASTQVNYFSQTNRFGRLSEVNNLLSSSLGTPSGNDINRGNFVLSMTPSVPTDAELRVGFTITATRNVSGEGVTYIYELTQTGEIRQISPVPGP